MSSRMSYIFEGLESPYFSSFSIRTRSCVYCTTNCPLTLKGLVTSSSWLRASYNGVCAVKKEAIWAKAFLSIQGGNIPGAGFFLRPGRGGVPAVPRHPDFLGPPGGGFRWGQAQIVFFLSVCIKSVQKFSSSAAHLGHFFWGGGCPRSG